MVLPCDPVTLEVEYVDTQHTVTLPWWAPTLPKPPLLHNNCVCHSVLLYIEVIQHPIQLCDDSTPTQLELHFIYND